MIVQITDDLRLNRYDKRNWTLEQWRTPKVLKDGITPEEAAKWYPCNCFFQSLGAGLVYVLEHQLLQDEEVTYTVQEAVQKVEEIATDLKQFAIKHQEKE